MIVSTKHKLERAVMLVVVWSTVLTVAIRPGQEPLKLSIDSGIKVLKVVQAYLNININH